MTEIYNSEHCELWEKAKGLAQERGLDMSPKCPMDEVCKETRCFFLNDETDEGRLEKLREELDGYMNRG